MNYYKYGWLTLCFMLSSMLYAQKSVYQTLSLDKLSKSFNSPSNNWKLASKVTSDYRSKHDITFESGQSILVNNGVNGKDIFTKLEHGDIDLEMEFMLPKATNSGIYLQGRYEIQLKDSWAKKRPNHADCGGIYERWDNSQPKGEKGYQGKPPRTNACNAPGTWQKILIRFQAPRFDKKGKKTQNARVLEVRLNDVVVQQNVELLGMTRGSAFDAEAAKGPLRLQGDHGPIAFRNIKYKLYEEQFITPFNISVDYSNSSFDSIPQDLSSIKWISIDNPSTVKIDKNLLEDRYIVQYQFDINIPQTSLYNFDLGVNSNYSFYLDGKKVKSQKKQKWYDRVEQPLNLKKGKHSIKIITANLFRWEFKNIFLGIEMNGMRKIILSDPNVAQKKAKLPITKDNAAEVELIRSFFNIGDAKRSHTINVGTPSKMNFNYDLVNASLNAIWRGNFLNMTQMWSHRGTQLAFPLSPKIETVNIPTIQKKGDIKMAYKNGESISISGYKLDWDGFPVFMYDIDNTSFFDHFRTGENNKRVIRTIHTDQPDSFQMILAAGKSITTVDENVFLVDEKYILDATVGKLSPEISTINGTKVLISKTLSNENKYAIIW